LSENLFRLPKVLRMEYNSGITGLTRAPLINKSDTLETVRNLTPDGVFFSSVSKLKPALIIYVMETIEQVVCNGEELELRQLDANLYFAETKGRDDS